MSSSYAPPTGQPPSTATTANPPASQPTDDDPFDPPPAYTPSAAVSGETTVDAGPSRMDFSGPPPLPDRLQQNITGVGIGYGPTHHHTSSNGGGWGVVSPQPTGSGFASGGGGGNYHPPLPPPRHPSTVAYNGNGNRSGNGNGNPFNPPPGPPPTNNKTDTSSSSFEPDVHDAGPSRPSAPSSSQVIDLSPTEMPTPGRPLLYRGQLLVYPKGFFCHKCGNTGYKANDPSNPHEADWRKYGKPYNSALSHSYAISTNPSANPSTTSSSNFQRPLPALGPSPTHHIPPPAPPAQNPYGHLPPPPGKWNTYPGQIAPPAPHHQPTMMPPPPGPMPGQQIFVQRTPGPVPPGALVVGPGDPRIGGRLCWRCSGSGREISFFGFDDGRCYECRGLGRLF
ncbi:hypothetical protein IAR55_003498 [Kwoniella newhampshirensis]|uniref:Uncharacterized protein n=1 Tax=Kwoniella newhampshirensis TaxID=1651941 RepID=A0AAW0YZI7_9TREE